MIVCVYCHFHVMIVLIINGKYTKLKLKKCKERLLSEISKEQCHSNPARPYTSWKEA